MAKENNYNVLAKPTAKHGRNAFNLNNQHVYSMRAGLLNPIKAIHFMPGDFFKIKASDFSITFPMNAAPFLRLRKEFSFYSVYYSAVWSLFNQYMAGRQDPKSSAFGVNPKLHEPRIKLINLYSTVLNQFGAYVFLEYYMPEFARIKNVTQEYGLTDEELQVVITNAKSAFFDDEFTGTFNYLTSLDFGNDNTVMCSYAMSNIPHETGTWLPHTWDCFNCLPYEYYQGSGQLHGFDIYQDIVGHYRFSNQLRKLDMLGYGNMYPVFNKMERMIRNAFDLHSETMNAITDAVNSAFFQIMWKMVETMCNFPSGSVPDESDITSYKMVNLYPICSWNSIFYHFFRNSFYDNDYCNHDYSLDFISTESYSEDNDYNEVTLNDFSSRFLDCEYHQWKKDLFTSVLPDEQFGAVSAISLNNITNVGVYSSNAQGDVQYNAASYPKQLYIAGSSGNPISHTHTITDLSFDMIALKRSEMLQEYRQTLMRAGNKTSDVFRALYGGSPSSEHLDDIIPRFLETFGEDIAVDPVVSTANTEQGENGKLGDISARGKCSGTSNRFKFDAGENFGCIIVMAYVVPTSMYNSYMLDKHLLELTPEQHFIPNFENCGLEDIYTDELNMLLPTGKIASLGKQARYYHKKTDVDKVHGAFCSMLDFAAYREGSPRIQNIEDAFGYFGEFNHWISARTDMQTRNITTLRDFYINPSVLDNIFVSAVGADQSQDQFICTTLLEVDATKQMSKVGYVNFV